MTRFGTENQVVLRNGSKQILEPNDVNEERCDQCSQITLMILFDEH